MLDFSYRLINTCMPLAGQYYRGNQTNFNNYSKEYKRYKTIYNWKYCIKVNKYFTLKSFSDLK